MSVFYTNVALHRNDILFRGINIENGSDVRYREPVKPRLYITSKKSDNHPYYTIDGKTVSPVDFDSAKEARDFIKKYDDVSNFHVYGFDNFLYPWIYRNYSDDINYRSELLRIYNIDIETVSDQGFPDVSVADKEITAITVKDKHRNKFFTFGCQKYKVKSDNVKYYHCRDEHDLLLKFIDFWITEYPHVVTGWNINIFDIPYLVHRIERILGEGWSKKFSPWGIIESRTAVIMGKENVIYDFVGISMLDYLDLYKKFTYTQQESYKLDNIAHVELGEKKIDYSEYEGLMGLYRENFDLFLDYNIQDVELVDRLDNKLKLLDLVFALAYSAKINYSDAFSPVKMWDVIIHNHLLSNRIVVPYKKSSSKNNSIVGAYVKEPQKGLHEWIMSLDLTSLYPHIIMQWNMSPETIQSHIGNGLGGSDGIDDLISGKIYDKNIQNTINEKNLCLAASGWTFDNNKHGFLPQLMEKYFNLRKQYKKKMLDTQSELEKVKAELEKSGETSNLVELKKQLENEVSAYDNMQMAVKIALNSGYGALSNQYFRWYDDRIAESITLCGQLVIKWSEKSVNTLMNKILKTKDVDYVITMDTDSCIVTLGPLVDKFIPKGTEVGKIVKIMAKFVSDKIEPHIDSDYARLRELTNAYAQKMNMKREVIGSPGIFLAKKKYIINVYQNESVHYSTPKIKMMGVEAIRSSTPTACREAIKDILKVILSGDEEGTQKFISDFKKQFITLPFEEIAFPRGVNGLSEYSDNKGIYKKGCPIHVRGALIYNNIIKTRKLDMKYQKIQEGEKIKFCYMKTPNPTHENVISTPGNLPRQLGLDQYIDYETQFEKSFISPIRQILDVIGWEIEKRHKIDDFFS